MADKPKGRPTRLKITSCTSVYSGTNSRGDFYEIHEIQAVRENGEMINEKLRSFEMLPVGELLDLTVTPFDSDKHGRSYTLSQKNRPRGQSGELQAQLAGIDERLKRVEAQLALGPGAPQQAVEAPSGQKPPQSLDEKFGAPDDIPF